MIVVALLAGLMLASTVAGSAREDAGPRAAAAVEGAGGAAGREAPGRLFVIERSKNANVVAYDVRFGPSGFDPKDPISARWLMLDEEGQTEGLTKLERKVYGVKVKSASFTEVDFAIAALPERSIIVRLGADGPEAIVSVNGVPCRLESIYVSSSEGLVPTVKWVELKGRSLADGSLVTERVTR